MEISLSPLEVEGSLLVTSIIRDVTDRRRSEAEQHFLAEATAQCAASLDLTETLEAVARLTVPFVADYCAVDLIESDGSIRHVALAAVEPATEEALRRYVGRPVPEPERHPASRIVRTGRPEVYADLSNTELALFAQDAEHLNLLQGLGLHASYGVPFPVRGEVLGVVTFAFAGRRYSSRDLALSEELARRCGQAIDNARLYQAEHRARAAAE